MNNLPTIEELKAIIATAERAANFKATEYFQETMGGEDRGSCGFAFTRITEYNGVKINGNTKMGRMLKKLGISQNYARTFEIWNPSRMGVQNIDTLEVGARACADILKQHGFTAYAGSRLD